MTHPTLLNAAARKYLRPIGLVQKGRSRIWIADQGWWVCVVEHQPSDWSRGSYLNVGCMWLWDVKNHISFDEGGRVELFTRFHDDAQFEMVANSIAERAAQEVSHYRGLFPNIKEVCAHYRRHPPDGFWRQFHSAVALALAGQADRAQRLFRQVTDADDRRDWVVTAQADANQLGAIADDVKHFREVVSQRVQKTRELQKLPARTTIDFDQ